MDPTATVILDGTFSRSSIDFPSTITGYLLVQWTPADGTSSAELSEMNSFSSSSLNTYEVMSDIPAVGELFESKGDQSKDGKAFADFKGGKEMLPPAVGERLPSKIPFVPGSLGAPVILNKITLRCRPNLKPVSEATLEQKRRESQNPRFFYGGHQIARIDKAFSW